MKNDDTDNYTDDNLMVLCCNCHRIETLVSRDFTRKFRLKLLNTILPYVYTPKGLHQKVDTLGGASK
jgi:hypothetical protein